tara:strand:+ start:1656 stop:1982 length:327 start_codon:yes stop_codon:yes gene_type:complete
MSEKTPSFLDMIKGFATDVVEYAKQGAPHVTENQYKERIRTCATCPDLIKKSMRCGKCGCLVEQKARWATTACPASKWPKVKIGSGGKKIQLGTKKDESKSNNPKASE